MRIERVSHGQLNLWVSLRQELWPHCAQELIESGAKELFQTDNYWAYLGYLNDDVIGFVELSIHEEVVGLIGTPASYLEAWYVRDAFRGQGYGREFIDFAEAFAKVHNHKYLASDTTSRYSGSLQAHLATGFEEVKTVHHFIKELEK